MMYFKNKSLLFILLAVTMMLNYCATTEENISSTPKPSTSPPLTKTPDSAKPEFEWTREKVQEGSAQRNALATCYLRA